MRQPVSARDLSQTVIAALTREVARRKTYDVPGRNITLFDMLNTIQQLLGRKARLLRIPRGVALAAYEMSRLLPAERVSGAAMRFLRWYEDLSFDGSDAERELGHAPRDFVTNMREQLAGLST